MIDVVVTFAVATVASFIGSLQAGLVNTAVLAATLRHGPASGMRTAWGGCIPEFIYAAVAFTAADRILAWTEGLGGTVDRVAGGVMIVLGVYFLFFLKPFPSAQQLEEKRTGFMNGLLLGLMNPQLLLFWCGVRLALESFEVDVHGWPAILAFGLGAFCGAMILLMMLVRLGRRMQERLGSRALHNIFRLVGALLVATGIVAWLR